MNTISLDITDLPELKDCAEGEEVPVNVTIKVIKNDGKTLTGEVTEAECDETYPEDGKSEGGDGPMMGHRPAAVIAILGPKGK